MEVPCFCKVERNHMKAACINKAIRAVHFFQQKPENTC